MSAAPAFAADKVGTHTISVFVNNKPGVLVRVALVFSRRGFNIESLVVSPGVEGRFSRMTITCSGNAEDLEQVVKQLAKLVDVVHAIDHTSVIDCVWHEPGLKSVASAIAQPASIMRRAGA